MMFLGSVLFADLDKHQKYGTMPIEYDPVPVFINPDYIDIYRNEVTITVGGGSWDSEISWQLDTDPAGDTPLASGGAPFSEVITLPDGMYLLTAIDSYNDGWNGASFTITDANGAVLFTYDGPPYGGSPELVSFEIGGGIPGCMDATACNYDDLATEDDGSCCLTNCVDLTIGGGSYISEVSWEILDASATVIYSGGGTEYSGTICLDNGTYMINGYDSWGDGWNGNVFTLVDSDGNTIVDFTFDEGTESSTIFVVPFGEVGVPGLFFSEYGEGSSSNKYLEIYNGTGDVVSLDDVFILGNYNGNPWSETFTFQSGATIDAGDVYIIASSDADPAIVALADEVHAYGDPWYITAFNGDDVRALAQIDGEIEIIIDIIGTLDADGDGVPGEGGDDDPGSGWSVAGIENATKDHTLVRKSNVSLGNAGDWINSAGMTENSSEWHVLEQNNWDNLGSHFQGSIPCELTEVTINLYDSYGDGWNGNVLNVGLPSQDGAVELTIENGSEESYVLCLADGTYPISCDGGDYQGEVSWEILAADGTVLLAGGAPYEGEVIQVGDFVDSFGCTDPLAYNYDETVTVEDGSCYYDGDYCSVALPAIEGAETGNPSSGASQWYSYTATMDGFLTATTCYSGQMEDTYVEIYTSCDEGVELLYWNDDADCGDETGGNSYASQVEFQVQEGETYYFLWDDYYSPGPFTWYLYESPLAPRNLVANGGIQSASLDWIAYNVVETEAINRFNQAPKNLRFQSETYLQKKNQIKIDNSDGRNSFWVNPDLASNSRATSVTIQCGGGNYESEVSWEIIDAGGTVIASGGAPSTLDIDLQDGTYLVNGYDSWGDGWNGNVLTIDGEVDGQTTNFLTWTFDTGSEASTYFSIGDVGSVNLIPSNIV